MYNIGHDVPKCIKQFLAKFLDPFILMGALKSVEGLNRSTVAALCNQNDTGGCIRTNMLNGLSDVYHIHIVKKDSSAISK